MAFSLPSEASVKHIKFLRGIFHSSNRQVPAVLVIIYNLNFYLPGSLSRYRSHLLQWKPSLQQSIFDEKMISKNTKLSNNANMQHNQFIPTFQLLVGLLFPEIKNSLGEIFYQQTTSCPLILHWKIEVSWTLPCNLWSLKICRVPAFPLHLPAFATPHCGGIIWTGRFSSSI